MLIHDLTFAQCVQLLQRNSVGHLGCAKDDEPYVVPIHYSFDAERHVIYAVSTVGQKVEWMRANPRVCLTVDEITDKNHWTTVVLNGSYEEVGDLDADDSSEAQKRAQQLFQRRKEWWLPAMAKHSQAPPRRLVVFQVRIDRMTGRRSSRNDLSGNG
jgi:nitroimidazol reductase NimA-like FMN-containing flavoprotein (pyridoxamine 5'-phosphate oxidase superfamily)